MNCEEAQQLLDALAAGELDDARRQTVEDHVGECPACQKELAAMRRTIRILTGFREMDPPADFVQELRQRLGARRRRSILERLVPRPVFARVLAGAGCLILAGFGVWVAARQFFPPERTGKDETGHEIAGKRIALVRGEEKRALTEAVRERGAVNTKAGEKLDLVGEERTEEVSLFERHAARRAKAPAGLSETPGGDLTAVVSSKGSAVAREWGRAPALPAEEPAAAEGEVEGAVTAPARSYAARPEGAERGVRQARVTATVKAVPEAVLAEPVTRAPEKADGEKAKVEGRDVLREGFAERSAEGREYYSVAGKEGPHEKKDTQVVGGGSAGIELQAGIAQEQMARPADEEERVAKYRPGAGGELKEAKGAVGANDVELRREEEEIADSMTGLGTTFDVQKPDHDKSGLMDLAKDYGYIPLYLNGAGSWREGITGAPQIQTPDSGAVTNLHFVPGNFGVYGNLGTGSPALVRYVKDRKKIRGEIEKIVADLGGSITGAEKQTTDLGRAFGDQQVEALVVKLKPDTYDDFVQRLGGEHLQKLVPHRGAAVAGPASTETTAGQAVEAEARKKDAEVTLVIFLVEIKEERRPDSPSEGQPTSGS
jgi:anti-sigma factor RsiW